MSGEVWATVYDRLAQLIEEHHTTLIFANTRRMVERVSRHLAERLGETAVAAHHGSLSKETRFDAEQRLKAGSLKVMVATASLELGIDIGDVELVCQLGTPRSISVFLQRVGRANHSVSGVPKGRIFPSSRDELVDCVALLDAVRRGELDRLHIPEHPLDVLSQQIVAEVAAREYGEDELFDLVRRAYPYRNLERKDFDAVVRMLAEGISTKRGRRGTYLHRDAVNKVLRPRKGARLTAITCGGAIPDNADYQVILEPAGIFVGTLNEDFAIESLAGDIFQLGNTSYRILRVEAGRVRVEDAKGQPPSIPFWLGEAPARTDELSAAVSRLRADIEALLPEVTSETVARAIDARRSPLSPAASRRAAAGGVPGRRQGRARQTTHARYAGVRTVLRRIRRHAAHHPCAFWRAHQPRLRPLPAQEILPHVQLRAAGRGHRRRHRVVARRDAQLRARKRGALPEQQDGGGHADPGHAGFAHVHRALALECQHLARHPPQFRRQAHAAEHPAHGRRRSHRRGVSGPDCLRRESLRTARDSRSSAGQADAGGLPARGHGCRRAQAAVGPPGKRRNPGDREGPANAVTAGGGDPQRAAVRLPRRCAARRTPHQRRGAAPLARSRNRRRHGQARSAGDCRGARGSLAGSRHAR